MNRKWDGIDLMKLYSQGHFTKWNAFLKKCRESQDVEALKKTLYGIQVGMDDVVKKNLANESLVNFFLRLQRSIEKTAKEIFRAKYPNPCDHPKLAKEYASFIEAKRKRDEEFEGFLRKSSF